MASMTMVWCEETRQPMGLYATSQEADQAILRLKRKREGVNTPTMSLDKVTVSVK